MTIRIKVINWFTGDAIYTMLGHAALLIYEPNNLARGLYISSNHQRELNDALTKAPEYYGNGIYAEQSIMDYNRLYRSELELYGCSCVREIELPDIDLSLSDIVTRLNENTQREEKQEKELERQGKLAINRPYSYLTYNCANYVVTALRLIGCHSNKEAENLWFLLPQDVARWMASFPGARVYKSVDARFFSMQKDLVRLTEFAAGLQSRGHEKEAIVAGQLYVTIAQLLEGFVAIDKRNKTTAEIIEAWKQIQALITDSINKADPILSQHRGWKEVRNNILLFIVMLGIFWGIACAINKARCGKWLFYNTETKTGELIHRMAKAATIAKLDQDSSKAKPADVKVKV